MKHLSFLLVICTLCFITACTVNSAPTESEESPALQYYQLKTYTFASPGQVEMTDAYLAQAFIPALERQGIGPVGVFKNRQNETDTVAKTFVLIPFSSLEEFEGYEEALAQDPSYQQTGKAYLEATHEAPPYSRIRSDLLRAFEDMPEMMPTKVEGPRSERVYELRSYESPTEAYYTRKVDMFNAGGEIKLFERLNFNAVFYAEVLAGADMPNLVYMTTFPNQVMRDSLWKEFVDSPEWTELKEIEKYKHTVSAADILLLYPTDYSAY